MSELKKCPFCGGKAVISAGLLRVRYQREKTVTYTPRCKVCQASLPYWLTQEKAVETWNHRTAAAKIEKAVNSLASFRDRVFLCRVESDEEIIETIDEIIKELKS